MTRTSSSSRAAFTLAQLVMLEIAAGALAVGLAARGPWLVAGAVVAVLFAAGAAVPVRRRWLYQVLVSCAGLLRRRRRLRRGTGIAALVGGYEITTVAGATGGPIAVIHAGTTWSVPLEVRLDDVFNDDADVPLAGLATLLSIEDVPLASVRLLTLTTPAVADPAAPQGPAAAPARAAARYCVLTLDTMSAAAAVAARGGSVAAVAQILRRCVLRGQEVLGNAGLAVRPLDEAGLLRLLDGCLGPALEPPDGSPATAAESWSAVRVGGTQSATVAVAGRAVDVLPRLAAMLPTVDAASVAASVVELRRSAPSPPAGTDPVVATLLLRASAPVTEAGSGPLLRRRLADAARRAGLVIQHLDGEQATLLRASTPVGLPANAS